MIVCELSKRGTTERLGGEWPEYWSLYGDKNGERRRFQVDLGIALMNYGIGLDWDGDKDSQRPSWMRQSEFVPCDCEKCFFCLHGLTNGIAHPRNKNVTIEYACGSRRRTNKCSTERVLLKKKNGEDMDYSDYCRMCLRMQPDNDYYRSLTSRQRKKLCNNSRTGCVQCEEPICDSCWPKYDKHKAKVD